jgi:putative peptidoglycan lipid II flippase
MSVEKPPLKKRSSSKNAVLVGSGILLSRVLGFIRGRIFAHYFGNTAAADAFNAAFKIPNFLQNLFGEGALSSSFIPVYASLLASDREEEANRVARVTGSLLAVVVSILVLVGILAAPLLTYAIAPGFTGVKRDFTVQMVRIIFPGTGVLVLSAWCLGILNSHRRFFLPYAAPVLWNLAMIGVLLKFGGRRQLYNLAEIVAWGSVLGSVLQFGVQLPSVLQLTRRFQFQLEIASSNIRTVIRNFLPSLASRGANQVSSYVDSILASPLPTGAVAMLAYVQTIYLLPVSLFGMSISNAELPEMASQIGSDETVAALLRDRLNGAMRRVAFFIVPSVVGFLALGDSVIAFLYQTGKFTRTDVNYGWAVLAGSTVGLLASTLGRLYTSAFWALRDTRTPLRFAVLRVALTAALGWFLAFPVTAWLGIPRHLGLVGLTISAGMAAWIEFTLLRSALRGRVGKTGLQPSYLIRLWLIAIIAVIPSFAEKLLLRDWPPLVSGFLVLSTFGIIYFASAAAFKLPEALTLIRTISSKLRSRQSL